MEYISLFEAHINVLNTAFILVGAIFAILVVGAGIANYIQNNKRIDRHLTSNTFKKKVQQYVINHFIKHGLIDTIAEIVQNKIKERDKQREFKDDIPY